MLSTRDKELIGSLIQDIQNELKQTSDSFTSWFEKNAIFGESDKASYDYLRGFIEKDLEKLSRASFENVTLSICILMMRVEPRIWLTGSYKLQQSHRRMYSSLYHIIPQLDCSTVKNLLNSISNASSNRNVRDNIKFILLEKILDADLTKHTALLSRQELIMLSDLIEERIETLRMFNPYMSGHWSIPQIQKYQSVFDKLATMISGQKKDARDEKFTFFQPHDDTPRESDTKQKSDESKLPEKKGFYEILGVMKDATATDIKSAYRSLALIWHPDKAPTGKAEEYTDKFKYINEAYETLKDPEKRAMYDRGGPSFRFG